MTALVLNLRALAIIALLLIAACSEVRAAAEGRLSGTGGLLTSEGSAGGGLVPWATLAGLSTDPGFDWVVGGSRAVVDDFALNSVAIAGSINDRFELSLARARLDIDSGVVSADRRHIEQTIIGGKWRLAGDLIYGKAPQISIGVQAKWLHDRELARALGAEDDFGLDFYLSASRLVLDGPWHRNWLWSVNLRASRANELGFLGFGGDERDGYALLAEVSTALFFTPEWALGMEYRHKPDFLHALDESNWCDLYLAWLPRKRIHVALAYTALGTVANRRDQDGIFLSMTANF